MIQIESQHYIRPSCLSRISRFSAHHDRRAYSFSKSGDAASFGGGVDRWLSSGIERER